jgi:NAD-dependent deacetylase
LTPATPTLTVTESMGTDTPTPDIIARLAEAASLIRSARYLTAFTGAGISVESGIPPFRGPGGLWGKYDPRTLELDYFLAHPDRAWPVIKEIFYDNFGAARPNRAHDVLAAWETRGLLKVLITQNIDNLHYEAGSRNIVEFHGNSRKLACLKCGTRVDARPDLLKALPPRCPCGGIYKPDFIFFGEGIPPQAHVRAQEAAGMTDVMIVIGSTGEVYPAAAVPRTARENGASIIEVNPSASEFTAGVTGLFVPLKAGEALDLIEREITA